MTTTQATQRFEMVAVPQPKLRSSAATSYALAVRSAGEGAAYVIGADGPEHLPIEKLYFTSGDKEFEIDINNKTLTVADKARLRVTIFPIDIDAMNGHVIEHGEQFTVVLADETRSERPLKVKRWVAASAPKFERENLPSYVTAADNCAVSISATMQEAERAGGVKVHSFNTATTASHAPAPQAPATTSVVVDVREQATSVSATPIVPPAATEVSDIEVVEDATPFTTDESLEVSVMDPVTGARYKGREWRKQLAKQNELSLLQLRQAGYRVIILEMEHEKSATIALTDERGLPVLSIMTNASKPPVERVLTEATWNTRFGPNASFHFGVESMIDGSHANEQGHGDLSTPTVTRVTATAEPLRRNEIDRYEATNTLINYRKMVAQQKMTNDPKRDSLVRIASRRPAALTA